MKGGRGFISSWWDFYWLWIFFCFNVGTSQNRVYPPNSPLKLLKNNVLSVGAHALKLLVWLILSCWQHEQVYGDMMSTHVQQNYNSLCAVWIIVWHHEMIWWTELNPNAWLNVIWLKWWSMVNLIDPSVGRSLQTQAVLPNHCSNPQNYLLNFSGHPNV